MELPATLNKVQITIWTDTNPSGTTLAALGREAEAGNAYCSDRTVSTVNPLLDPEFPDIDFFGERDADAAPDLPAPMTGSELPANAIVLDARGEDGARGAVYAASAGEAWWEDVAAGLALGAEKAGFSLTQSRLYRTDDNGQIIALVVLPRLGQVSPLGPAHPSAGIAAIQRSIALEAIKARMAGEFDHPSLLALGPLSPNSMDDVDRILALALS